MYFIVGLGNPGEEYKEMRHNTGRMALDFFRRKNNFSEWEANKKYNALVSDGKLKKEAIILMAPETFMNRSGQSIVKLVTSQKKAGQLIVIYDDMDLPIGKFKISWNRSSGGHRGLESVIKSVKTEKFTRIRVGISPLTAKGAAKKPAGDEAVGKFILGKFKENEKVALKKVFKKVAEAVEVLVNESREKAMSQFN